MGVYPATFHIFSTSLRGRSTVVADSTMSLDFNRRVKAP
jgi:hypothetical protein